MNTQLQGVLITGVIIFFIIVLLLLKKRSLSLKYTLLWLLAGLVMAIMVLFPKLLVVLAHLSGIETPMYALFVVDVYKRQILCRNVFGERIHRLKIFID